MGSQSNLESGLSWVVVGEGAQPQGMWWGYFIFKTTIAKTQETVFSLFLKKE